MMPHGLLMLQALAVLIAPRLTLGRRQYRNAVAPGESLKLQYSSVIGT